MASPAAARCPAREDGRWPLRPQSRHPPMAGHAPGAMAQVPAPRPQKGDGRNTGDARNQPVWVAESDNGKLAGILEASVRNYADGAGRTNVGYLEGWYVRPPFRKKGVGKALVRAAEEWARGRATSTWARTPGSSTKPATGRTHSKAKAKMPTSGQALAMGYREVGRDVHYIKRLRTVSSKPPSLGGGQAR